MASPTMIDAKKSGTVSKEKASRLIKGEVPAQEEKKTRSAGEVRAALYGKDKQ